MIQVDVRADGSEKIKYDYDGYFAYVRRGLLSHYPNYAADSHWHDDLEFISVISGNMDYNVNGETIHLKEGQGIIVNARQLHYGFSAECNECHFYCILLHPMLLCASPQIDREFVAPLISDTTIPYLKLNDDVQWQRTILDDVEQIYLNKDTQTAQLAIQALFYHIWIILTENVLKEKRPKRQDRNLSVLKNLITFIQKNYFKKLTLAEIATSANVSKSTCLVFFKKYLHDTPINYLISYRLKQAEKLLKDTTLSISDIAYEVGFDGTSYFAETFRKNYGCSPSDFRIKY